MGGIAWATKCVAPGSTSHTGLSLGLLREVLLFPDLLQVQILSSELYFLKLWHLFLFILTPTLVVARTLH